MFAKINSRFKELPPLNDPQVLRLNSRTLKLLISFSSGRNNSYPEPWLINIQIINIQGVSKDLF